MEGLILVGALLAIVTAAGLRSRRAATAPGVWMSLCLAALCGWFLFA